MVLYFEMTSSNSPIFFRHNFASTIETQIFLRKTTLSVDCCAAPYTSQASGLTFLCHSLPFARCTLTLDSLLGLFRLRCPTCLSCSSPRNSPHCHCVLGY